MLHRLSNYLSKCRFLCTCLSPWNRLYGWLIRQDQYPERILLDQNYTIRHSRRWLVLRVFSNENFRPIKTTIILVTGSALIFQSKLFNLMSF